MAGGNPDTQRRGPDGESQRSAERHRHQPAKHLQGPAGRSVRHAGAPVRAALPYQAPMGGRWASEARGIGCRDAEQAQDAGVDITQGAWGQLVGVIQQTQASPGEELGDVGGASSPPGRKSSAFQARLADVVIGYVLGTRWAAIVVIVVLTTSSRKAPPAQPGPAARFPCRPA